MWSLIEKTMKNRAVILTSHSMEEVAALCQRICIMVAGKMRCIGSLQHLKSVYGSGYQLDVNVAIGDHVRQEQFRTWISITWPNSHAIELHENNMKYVVSKIQPPSAECFKLSQIPVRSSEMKMMDNGQEGIGVTIAQMFSVMNFVRESYSVRDYSVSETTLEQIFITLCNAGGKVVQS